METEEVKEVEDNVARRSVRIADSSAMQLLKHMKRKFGSSVEVKFTGYEPGHSYVWVSVSGDKIASLDEIHSVAEAFTRGYDEAIETGSDIIRF